jgi:hypothetical protein
MLSVTCTFVYHRQNWVAQFKCGDFSTCVAPRPFTTRNSNHNRDYWTNSQLILKYSWISAKSTAEQLGISRLRVGCIIRADMYMRKLFAKWVKKCLRADDESQLVPVSRLSNFGSFFDYARYNWYPVAIGDHGKYLDLLLWTVDKATANGVPV